MHCAFFTPERLRLRAHRLDIYGDMLAAETELHKQHRRVLRPQGDGVWLICWRRPTGVIGGAVGRPAGADDVMVRRHSAEVRPAQLQPAAARKDHTGWDSSVGTQGRGAWARDHRSWPRVPVSAPAEGRGFACSESMQDRGTAPPAACDEN